VLAWALYRFWKYFITKFNITFHCARLHITVILIGFGFLFSNLLFAESRLQNLSARGFVGVNDEILIGGFVITGSTQKTVVLRARGPALSNAGVTGALSNPTTTLFSGQSAIDSNDDWQNHGNQHLVPENLKPSNSLESVILRSLDAGAYTVIVSGVGNEQGIGLIEVFELDSNGDTRLLNLSARAQITSDDNILITGLIITGIEHQRVLIRAKGPSLIDDGVPDALENPRLTLLSGQNVIDNNDDWQSHPRMNDIPVSLKPTNDLDSAILIELAPGAYTAIVESNNALGGIGIVEVFDLGTVVPIPLVLNDSISTSENILISIDVLQNDENINENSLSISQNPTNGLAVVNNGLIDYTPNDNFTGEDLLLYSVTDGTGNLLIGELSITVVAFVATRIVTSNLTIPTTNYTQQNNVELSSTVLTSPNFPFSISNDTVSFSITLQGDDVATDGQNLFISSLSDPLGMGPSPFQKEVLFCDPGLCSALIPRKPEIITQTGSWQYTLGTLESSLTGIDLNSLILNIVVRKGPQPNLAANFPATLEIKPYLTATSISEEELGLVLTQFTKIANNNRINVNIAPITILVDSRFEEVSSDFENVDTAELVTMGDAGTINLFFIESFTGFNGGGILGISGGLPGTMGIKGKFNGVLINATATRGGPDEFYARTTAEFAFHEMGHFLGLYHTTERRFGDHDVITDTPECRLAIHDSNGNGIADLDECPDALNIMFWNSELLTEKELMSNDQQTTIYYSPIAKP